MGNITTLLLQDVRFQEALNACMNCGVCTAICPSAEFYNYDPRKICDIVQREEDVELEKLLRSETIWYCGECMSCATRCPRGNTPGLIIMALRKIAQQLGYFVDSEKGRQQFILNKVIGGSILERGYCVHPDIVAPELHPEQGPIWKWYRDNIKDVAPKLGANYKGEGAGALRQIADKNLEEIKKIFEATGALDFQNNINRFSNEKRGTTSEQTYLNEIYTTNNNTHNRRTL
ncbi:MAG: 4Fe-4S dicluster domain-containing protein [Bacteroidetes bacterium]|nr:4Fe-4S dicluster domain-containing protein [Bacteroidota bacterium]MCL2303044.1 4Fe-4S dicluster domain-containing protein [Lentimicrobiaceae bacterium]